MRYAERLIKNAIRKYTEEHSESVKQLGLAARAAGTKLDKFERECKTLVKLRKENDEAWQAYLSEQRRVEQDVLRELEQYLRELKVKPTDEDAP